MDIIGFLNGHIDLISVLWLFPVTFLFHDLEEVITVEKWVSKHGEHVQQSLPAFAKKMLGSSLRMNTLQFAKDVLGVYSVIVLVTGMAVFFDFYLPFLAALHLYFFHVFTHLGQTVFLKKYTPGVITAVFPVLPYSLYAYYRLLAGNVIDIGDLLWALVLLLVLVPAALYLMIKGRDRYASSK